MELEAYEVFVNPEAIIEINRGEHMTTAQAFGADWTAQPVAYMHPASFHGIANQAPEVPEDPAREYQPPLSTPKYDRLFVVAALILAGALAWGIVSGW